MSLPHRSAIVQCEHEVVVFKQIKMFGIEMTARSPTTAAIVVGILLSWCPGVVALDPSLDVSQYAHTTWKVREGFSKGAIFSIAQTPDGYFWLGTEFGLLRFDGVRNTVWQPPAGQHLPSSDVRTLLVARDGRLWIGTNGGLASWKDGQLTHYPELDGQTIEALLEDREGTIWVGVWAPLDWAAVHDSERPHRVLRAGRPSRLRR